MTSQELKDEIRYDLLVEAREESLTEIRLREDPDYALDHFTPDIIAIVNQLEVVQKKLANYGHEYTLAELLDQHI